MEKPWFVLAEKCFAISVKDDSLMLWKWTKQREVGDDIIVDIVIIVVILLWISHYSSFTSNDQGGAWHMEHLFIDICTYFVVQLLSWYFIISYSWSPTVIFVIIQNDSTTVCWYYVESGDGRDYWDYEADNNVIEVWLSCAQGANLLWNSFNGNQYQWDFYWKPFLIGFCCWMNKLGKHRRFETHFKKYTLKNYTLEHLEDM